MGPKMQMSFSRNNQRVSNPANNTVSFKTSAVKTNQKCTVGGGGLTSARAKSIINASNKYLQNTTTQSGDYCQQPCLLGGCCS